MRSTKSPNYKSARGKTRMTGGVSFDYQTSEQAQPAPEPTLSLDQYRDLCAAWNRDNPIGTHVVYSDRLQTTTASVAFVSYVAPFIAIIKLNGLDGHARLEDLQVKEVKAA